MAREPSLAVYRSVFRATEHLSRRARGAFLLALCEFYFDGVEPHDLPRDAMNVWRGVEYRIQRARAKANATDGEPLPDGQRTSSEPLPNAYPEPTDSVAGSIEDIENVSIPAETSPAHADVDADAHAEGWGLGCGRGLGRGHSNSNVRFPSGETNPLPLRDKGYEEKVDAVYAYAESKEFDAITLANSAIEDWVTQWSDNRWLDVNGQSLDAMVTPKDGGERVPRWQNMFRAYALGAEAKARGEEAATIWHDGKCHKCGGHAQWRMGGDGVLFRCGSCGEYTEWL